MRCQRLNPELSQPSRSKSPAAHLPLRYLSEHFATPRISLRSICTISCILGSTKILLRLHFSAFENVICSC